LFLKEYEDTLRQETAGMDTPAELTESFTFNECVKRRDDREVYFVTRKTDEKRAVLRITRVDSGENANEENAILTALDHPAIPKAFGAWEYKGRSFLAREYFEGDDLNIHIRKHGVLSRDRIIDIALQLCDILTYIHGQSPAVIHRDIKPENIIVSEGNRVKLIDFGIARDFRVDADRDTRVAGTRPYMSPEQFGYEQTDIRTDIYSLGVVIIYMATGKTDRASLRSAYPYKDLIPVIEKCVETDRDRRYNTAAELKKSILWIKRRMARNALACAAVCVLLGAAFALGFYTGHRRGVTDGIAKIMDAPADMNRPFTAEQHNEQLTFDNWYLDMAIRNILNTDADSPIYRIQVLSYVGDIQIFGTSIMYPSPDNVLTKQHIDKEMAAYYINGIRVYARGDVSSLEDIPNAYYLRDLTLISQNISDLTPLSGMKLELIRLCDNYIGNLLPLKDMLSLRELDICQNPVKDLTPISRLLSLKRLDISHTQITDLSPVKGLTKLEALSLNYCDIDDISVLKNLPNLREVDLGNTKVTDLSPLIRKDNPITVTCAGLDAEVIEKARSEGIVIIEEGNAYD
jgi:serine/threonine protein kinase